MFRSTVPNNMLPRVPKPILLKEEEPPVPISYENHMTDVEYDAILYE